MKSRGVARPQPKPAARGRRQRGQRGAVARGIAARRRAEAFVACIELAELQQAMPEIEPGPRIVRPDRSDNAESLRPPARSRRAPDAPWQGRTRRHAPAAKSRAPAQRPFLRWRSPGGKARHSRAGSDNFRAQRRDLNPSREHVDRFVIAALQGQGVAQHIQRTGMLRIDLKQLGRQSLRIGGTIHRPAQAWPAPAGLRDHRHCPRQSVHPPSPASFW